MKQGATKMLWRSTRVWNPCGVITVPFQNRSPGVILAKTGQTGQYKKGVSQVNNDVF